MSLKYYGIFIAYPPLVDLRCEGLGRHLAAFIKGAEDQENVRFIVACPSWNKKMLTELFYAEGVNENAVDIYSPKGRNISVVIGMLLQYVLSKGKKIKRTHVRDNVSEGGGSIRKKALSMFLAKRNPFLFVLLLIFSLPFLMFGILGYLIIYSLRRVKRLVEKTPEGIKKFFASIFIQLKSLIVSPLELVRRLDLYQYVEAEEMKLMIRMINGIKNVEAWYCPAAFWPEFNKINAPKLICIPDVVFANFPIGFSLTTGPRHLHTFNKVERIIREGSYFVTYSQHIKETILVEKYDVLPERVRAIPHSVNRLDHMVSIQGYDAMSDSSTRYCQQLFVTALNKSTNYAYAIMLKNPGIKFFFYASQFRSSKNVLTLLKAYKFLLCNRFIGHKLILTGHPGVMKEIDSYIYENRLSHEVILLPGLSTMELAACYKLADLAINPSLSEGGFPFTFSEALSVNTPVIMADIPVTREVITDKKTQEMMLFDPYSWRALAQKVEWALENRQELLAHQIEIYNQFKQRTWTNVVKEYIDMLDHIALCSKLEKQDNMREEKTIATVYK